MRLLASLQLVHRFCVQVGKSLHFSCDPIFFFHQLGVCGSYPLHRLLVVRFLLLEHIERALQSIGQPVPLICHSLQSLPMSLQLLAAIRGTILGRLRLLQLNLVELAFHIQEIVLQLLSFFVLILQMLSKLLFLVVQSFNILSQTLQLLCVHLLLLIVLHTVGIGVQLLQARLQHVPLILQLVDLSFWTNTRSTCFCCLLGFSQLVQMNPHCLQLGLQSVVRCCYIAQLVLNALCWGCRRTIHTLILQALNHLCKPRDCFHQLLLQLFLLVVCVAQHLL
mmetsp:Transcript_49429/g.107738  ORF Transcript_49429/g.107738 Transcript_49429/m.107738 type:complete len:279 (-) Transcript_49429:956-1792(-)